MPCHEVVAKLRWPSALRWRNRIAMQINNGEIVYEDGGDLIMEIYDAEKELESDISEEKAAVVCTVSLDQGYEAYSQTKMAREYELTSRLR